MAKVSSVQKNNKRKKMSASMAAKRKAIKDQIYTKDLPIEERFNLVLKLAKLPRNAAKTRVRNRCALTGRPRGVYSKMGLSRNMIRELAGKGMLPGIIKASW